MPCPPHNKRREFAGCLALGRHTNAESLNFGNFLLLSSALLSFLFLFCRLRLAVCTIDRTAQGFRLF